MNVLAKLLLLAALAALFACAESSRSQSVNTTFEQENIVTENSDRERSDIQRRDGVRDETGGIPNLPFARGETFRTLDAYLAHLQAGSAVGLPWWREIRPGVYQQVTTMTGKDPEIATREDLARRFGFES